MNADSPFENPQVFEGDGADPVIVEFKNLACDILAGRQGLKATELVADERIAEFNATHEIDVATALEELVAEKRVLEIEYTVPNLPERLKSFYLPMGSIVTRIAGATDTQGISSKT